MSFCKKKLLPAKKLSLLKEEQSTLLMLRDFIMRELCYFATQNVYFMENRTPDGFLRFFSYSFLSVFGICTKKKSHSSMLVLKSALWIFFPL